MTESIHEFVIGRLQAMKGQWPAIARDTGISRRTIEKVARREVQDPSVRLIEQLAAYFRRGDNQKSAAS